MTKVDGINYCSQCLAWLAAMGGEVREQATTAPAGFLSGLSAFGFFVLLTLMTWGMLEVALPG